MKKNEKYENDSAKIKNVFLIIFVLISICLCATLFFSYKINNRSTNELSLQKDIFRLRAEILPFQSENKIKGVIEMKEVNYNY